MNKVPLLGRAVALICTLAPVLSRAQGFDKVNTTVINILNVFAGISVAVATIAIMWLGYKILFGGARLAEVAHLLIGATFLGGAGAFAAFLIN